MEPDLIMKMKMWRIPYDRLSEHVRAATLPATRPEHQDKEEQTERPTLLALAMLSRHASPSSSDVRSHRSA